MTTSSLYMYIYPVTQVYLPIYEHTPHTHTHAIESTRYKHAQSVEHRIMWSQKP